MSSMTGPEALQILQNVEDTSWIANHNIPGKPIVDSGPNGEFFVTLDGRFTKRQLQALVLFIEEAEDR